MQELPDAVKGTLFAAFMVVLLSLSVATVLMAGPMLARGDWQNAGIWIMGWGVGVPVGTCVVFAVVLLPALGFHTLASRMGWRSLSVYAMAGGATGAGIAAVVQYILNEDSGLIPTYGILGLIGGATFWWKVVRPLRRAEISLKSAS